MKNMGYRGKKNLIYMQLRVMRVKRDVSQKELSARMQVMGFSMDQQTISNIENNRTKINLRVLMYYSKLCHISIDSLLNAGIPELIPADDDAVVEQEISRVLKYYNKDEKIKILNMLKIGKNLDLDV